MNSQPTKKTSYTAWFFLIGGLTFLLFTAIILKSQSMSLFELFSSTTEEGTFSGGTILSQTDVEVPLVTVRDHRRGASDPEITLIEYADFECPFCKKFHPVIGEILAAYPDEVQHVYRHFPLEIHEFAYEKAVASECVAAIGGEGAFWKFHDLLFDRSNNQGQGVAVEDLPAFALEVDVPEVEFTECYESNRFAPRVELDLSSGLVAGIRGTPTTIVVGPDGTAKAVPGAADFEKLNGIILELLQ